jgi:4,5-dihydroxyphthalate decarboxylase
MGKLRITLACWDYDRVSALASGQVPVDGVDLTMLTSPPEETFFRMVRHREFEASEMSLSTYVVTLMQDDPPFIAIPVFPSRVFRHGSIFVSTRSGIEKPADLIGKRVAAPEYQMTAPVWIRGMLSDEFGVGVERVTHFTGGVEQPGREEKLKLDLPSRIRVSSIGPKHTIAQMLADGELDAFFTARAPSTFYSRPGDVQRLFPDFVHVEQDYFRRTGIFPIMHTVVIRRDVYRANPWIAQSLYKAFAEAKRRAHDNLAQTAAFKVMLPWLSSHVEEARRELGQDWWPYGFAANRQVLDTFLRYHHEQGLSYKRLAPEQLFAPESLESFLV